MMKIPLNEHGSDLSGTMGPAGNLPDKHEEHRHGVLAIIREWLDVLIVAFLLAMFLRVFMIELFRIPSGSMTPALIGGNITRMDFNEDGQEDLLLFLQDQKPFLFLNYDGHLVGEGPVSLPRREVKRMFEKKTIQPRYDRILVNKLAYWFNPPRRGDIVIFKVPERIWDPEKPIFIKRCVGLPGDRLTFNDGYTYLDGFPLKHPEFFTYQRYRMSVETHSRHFFEKPEIDYDDSKPFQLAITGVSVPSDEIYVFGDNTYSSLDSRYWGGVKLNDVKGRAFFRYWPLPEMKFLVPGWN
jgi:signal peptidase I